jgi:hypothetical protein
MDISFLPIIYLLFIYLSYRNGVKAKKKSLNGILWGIITLVSCFLGYVVGVFVILSFSKDILNSLPANPSIKDPYMQHLALQIYSNPIHVATMFVFSIGGYLLVRYILDKKPGKKDEPPHWSDRLGENQNR